MEKKIIFITGGVRSGKSQFALEIGKNFPSPKAYLATAQALDEEMRQRISQHKANRSIEWETIEEPMQVSSLIKGIGGKYSLILLDCLTLWISNLLLSDWPEERIVSETDHLLWACREVRSNIIFVSNEVGWGIVPDNKSARIFRDLTGLIHQKIACLADEVYLMICGLPYKIKG